MAGASRRKRTFYISAPHASHNIRSDEPALQPIDHRDRQQQTAAAAAAHVVGADSGLRHYVSLLGCMHEWSDVRMLHSKQLVVAPYVLMSS